MNDLTNATILIVDDQPLNIDILAVALKDEYRVKVALKGERAVQVARTQPTDLILLDVMMPGMDGFEVCRRLKAAEATRDIPIIFITARSQSQDIIQGLKLGAVDYISKPLTIPVVQARVRTHLELRRKELALEHARRELERRVEERTAELAKANAHLKRVVSLLEESNAGLTASEKRIKALLDALPDLVVVLDADGRYLEALGSELINRYGAQAEVRGKRLHEYVPAEYADQVLNSIRQVLKTGETQALEYRIDTQAGPRWYEGRAARLSPETVVVVARDATWRREALEAVQRSSQLFQDLMDNSPSLIFLRDPEGRFMLVNKGFETTYGLPLEQITGKTVFELFPRKQAEQLFHDDQAILNGGRSLVVEETLVIAGQERVFHTAKFPLRGPNGRVDGVCGIAADITDLKQVEHRLRQAKEAAEAASRTKSSFLATMSHEIRTPLHGVLGMAQLLETTDLDDTQHSYLHDIEHAASNLLNLLNRLLDFASLEAGNTELAATPFSLRSQLEPLASASREQAEAKGLTFVLTVAPEVPDYLVGDADRIMKALSSLLDNAVKFSDQGRIELSVRCVPSDLPPGAPSEDLADVGLLFAVQDQGIGIAPDMQEHLFDPFSQLDASYTRRFGGAGLGLATARRLVELMGGQIALESSPGQGSLFLFSVRLPRYAEAEEQRRCPGPLPATLRILVVDPAASSRATAMLLLSWLGHAATVVADCPEALPLLEAGHWDCLLLDTGPGQPCALELVSHFPADIDDPQHRPRLIGLIGPDSAGTDENRHLADGLDAVLQKPLHLAPLQRALTPLQV